jgi:hypothetical protein
MNFISDWLSLSVSVCGCGCLEKKDGGEEKKSKEGEKLPHKIVLLQQHSTRDYD